MCGIVALSDPRLSTHELVELGTRMLDITMHRGPDNRGLYSAPPVFLGHNRLSIIDLSAASNQPMTSYGRTISYNGEIYNYIEIRNELQQDGYIFQTTGDVEVILAAFDRWGAGCVERFIGMWAFVIWDETTQTLFCSRDRFGIKPLHYIFRDGRLHIASEIKALKISPLFRTVINEAQVARGLYLGWMHHWDETYFNDIKALPAGCNLRLRDGKIDIEQYSNLDTETTSPLTFEEHSEQFRELFIDSIRLTARRDVEMGVCLSGGLDSTSIVSTLASSTDEHRLKTFTAYYTGKGDVDERRYIDHVLARYPQIEAHYISPTDSDVAEALDTIVWMMDAPMPSSSYVSQYFVMKLAALNGVRVVLDGQGSDEIMGGYMHSLYRIIADYFQNFNVVGGVNEWLRHTSRQSYSFGKRIDVLAKSLLTTFRDEPALYDLEFRGTYPWIMNRQAAAFPIKVDMSRGSRFNAFLYNLIYVTLLPTLLHTEDLNAMAFSIESRVPFLDHRLVQLCFSMPNAHRVRHGETKRVLRAAMRGIVPDDVLDRKDKTGFVTPGHVGWLRGALSHTLEGDWREVAEYVDKNELETVLSSYRAGNNKHALFVWRLVMLRKFLSK